MHVLPKVIYL